MSANQVSVFEQARNPGKAGLGNRCLATASSPDAFPFGPVTQLFCAAAPGLRALAQPSALGCSLVGQCMRKRPCQPLCSTSPRRVGSGKGSNPIPNRASVRRRCSWMHSKRPLSAPERQRRNLLRGRIAVKRRSGRQQPFCAFFAGNAGGACPTIFFG